MLQNLLIFKTILNDAPQPWQIGFQDSAAPGFTGIVELHNTIFFYLILICVGVFWMLGSIMYFYNSKKSPIIHKYLNHGTIVPIHKSSSKENILKYIKHKNITGLYFLNKK
jgi:cytochrome c oxidase subunit 2